MFEAATFGARLPDHFVTGGKQSVVVDALMFERGPRGVAVGDDEQRDAIEFRAGDTVDD